jgi:hypothetical protein
MRQALIGLRRDGEQSMHRAGTAKSPDAKDRSPKRPVFDSPFRRVR